MVYPASALVFQVGTKGRASAAADMAVVKDMEKLEVSFDSGVQEWKPLDTEGWTRRLNASKGLTIAVSGKRNFGDAGNDYIARLPFEAMGETAGLIKIVFPDGSTLTMPCVISVEQVDGGNGGDVGGLSFKCLSDGKPTYVRA